MQYVLEKESGRDIVLAMASSLEPSGGGDIPEALKTALKLVSKHVDDESLVILYTDAPPHSRYFGSNEDNLRLENVALCHDFDWLK